MLIDYRGLWQCNIVTDDVGNDKKANTIRAFLIPADYDPPEVHGLTILPPELNENAVDYVEMVRSP